MNAQKWISRVGHRIDQASDHLLLLGLDQHVLTAKGNNPRAGLIAGEAGHGIGVQARAHDQPVHHYDARGRADLDRATPPGDRGDRERQSDLTAGAGDVFGEGRCDTGEIGDGGMR